MNLEHDDLEIIICALSSSLETHRAHMRVLGEHESLQNRCANILTVRAKVETLLESKEEVWSL